MKKDKEVVSRLGRLIDDLERLMRGCIFPSKGPGSAGEIKSSPGFAERRLPGALGERPSSFFAERLGKKLEALGERVRSDTEYAPAAPLSANISVWLPERQYGGLVFPLTYIQTSLTPLLDGVWDTDTVLFYSAIKAAPSDNLFALNEYLTDKLVISRFSEALRRPIERIAARPAWRERRFNGAFSGYWAAVGDTYHYMNVSGLWEDRALTEPGGVALRLYEPGAVND